MMAKSLDLAKILISLLVLSQMSVPVSVEDLFSERELVVSASFSSFVLYSFKG